MTDPIDHRLLNILQCPRCHSELELVAEHLSCRSGHSYPIIDGVPVFILPEKKQTIGVALASYAAAANGTGGPLYLKTIGVSDVEKASIESYWAKAGGQTELIDPAISHLVGATSGLGYVNLIGRLESYPVPRIPIKAGAGDVLLDVGCNWGRWSISAARHGWEVVGIDLSLGAIMAARRAFLNERNAMFVCGDARFLPFKDNTFHCVFSYSVIQHFAETDTKTTLAEISRVLDNNGCSKIQIAHRGGLRSIYVQLFSTHSREGVFHVRYWSLHEIIRVFSQQIGPSITIPEAFGGLGLLSDDWRIVSPTAKMLIIVSLLLKKLAQILRPLIRLADSVYVVSTKS